MYFHICNEKIVDSKQIAITKGRRNKVTKVTHLFTLGKGTADIFTEIYVNGKKKLP